MLPRTLAEKELRARYPHYGRVLKAVDRILESLATGSFADKCGAPALDELREYRLDMALDITKELK